MVKAWMIEFQGRAGQRLRQIFENGLGPPPDILVEKLKRLQEADRNSVNGRSRQDKMKQVNGMHLDR